ncbi:MAG: (Fe-S)-binding protein [Gammaproteobacteria bacterium]
MTDVQNLEKAISQEASKCVKCGMCLPVCPTFHITDLENESPRGRISLMQGLTSHNLKTTSELTGYLDHCVQCLACEKVCPAQVNYSTLIRNTRELLTDQKAPLIHAVPKWLLWLVKHSRFWWPIHFLTWVGKTLGFTYLLRFKTTALLPRNMCFPKTLKSYYPAKTKSHGEVMLFTGCINSLLTRQIVFDAIKVLTTLGYGIHLPAPNVCCGALHTLSGNYSESSKLTTQTQNALSQKSLPIVSLTTGCQAHLEHEGFKPKIFDINTFLKQALEKHPASLKPFSKKVVIHPPCTHRNSLKCEDDVVSLLNNIPKIKLSAPKRIHCCGAAGDYVLKFPNNAKQLGTELAQTLLKTHPDFIASSNIGCELQLQKHIKALGKNTKVLHPVSIVAKTL